MSESHDLEQKLSNLYSENDDRFHVLVAAAHLDPQRDFKKRDLRGLIFDNADLTNFDFTDSDLRGTRLRFSCALPAMKLQNVRVDEEDATWITSRAAVQSTEDREMLEELRTALKIGGFEVRYQPIFDLKRRCVVRAEAIVDWHSKTFGQVSREKYIGMLTANGLINDLAKVVVEKVSLDQWVMRDNVVCCPISIELESETFENINVLSELRSFIQQSGADIRFIVGEGCVSSHDVNVKNAFNHLAESGIRIGVKHYGWNLVVEDFRNLSISEIQIDRALIQKSYDGANYLETLSSVIALRNVLHVELSADGVETEAQLAELEGLGVETAHGFVFGGPLDIAGLTDLRLWEKQSDDAKDK